MLRKRKTRNGVGLLIASLIGFMALPCQAQTPAASPPDDWVNKLAGLETAPDLDVATLKQQALDRIKSRADATPLKRPPVANQFHNMPLHDDAIQFDTE